MYVLKKKKRREKKEERKRRPDKVAQAYNPSIWGGQISRFFELNSSRLATWQNVRSAYLYKYICMYDSRT